MELYQHQKDIIQEDPKRCGLFLGTGSGKTATALSLSQGKTLVICPKTQFLDGNWTRELESMGKSLDMLVLSKEKFKKVYKELPSFDTVIIDEAHTCCGVTPDLRRRKGKTIPKASQLFEACQWYMKNHEPERIYLCTATPTRSPMAVWGASELLLRGNDFRHFRENFYYPVDINGYTRYLVRKDERSKELLGKLVQKIGFTGKLDDWFSVPDQVHRTYHCPLTKEQESTIKKLHVDFPDPIVKLTKQHMVENGILHYDEYTEDQFFNNNKIAKILDLAFEFPKLAIFARYLNQIEHIKQHLEKEGYKVITLTGATKDRQKAIADAEAAEACVFIAQSQISAGYEIPSFPTMCFASADYVFLNLEQARGRILRANKLKKNLYVYLESGTVDKAVWHALQHKSDFHEAIYLNEKRS